MSKASIFTAAMFLFLFSGVCHWADAADNVLWPLEGLPICTDSDDQSTPQIVDDGSGGSIIAWQNYRRGRDNDICAQRVDGHGRLLWAADGLSICTARNDQQHPRMAADGSGGALVVWWDYRGGSDYDIYAQRVDADGRLLWGTDGTAVCTAAHNQTHPQVVADGFGGAIVVWQDRRNALDENLYAQHVGAHGDLLWPLNGVPLCLTSGEPMSAQMAADGSGGAIICWRDCRTESGVGIYAQRVNGLGEILWEANGLLVCVDTTEQSSLAMAADGFGGVIVVWEDGRNGPADIYAQRIDAQARLLWQVEGVPLCTDRADQKAPQLMADGSGGAIVVWQDGRHGPADIFTQRVDGEGQCLWRQDGEPICLEENHQAHPQIVGDGSGGAVVAWEDYRSSNSYDIFAQRVNAYGRVLKLHPDVPVCAAFGDQKLPGIVGDGSGGAIITWQDQRSDNSDVSAQRISFNPGPEIVSIRDIPHDQGGRVTIVWQGSYLDNPEFRVVTHYSVWRKHPGGSRIEVMAEHWDGTLPRDSTSRAYRRTTRGDDAGESKMEFWEFVGSVEANHAERYGSIAPTLCDSSSSGIEYSWFIVSAHTAEAYDLWDSAPRSGYSVDNITPQKTSLRAMAMAGQSAPANSIELVWDRVSAGVDGSPEEGLMRYRVYGDTDPDFNPLPENLLATVRGLSFTHLGAGNGDPGSGFFYVVSAVDGSDNESAFSNRVGGIKQSLTGAR